MCLLHQSHGALDAERAWAFVPLMPAAGLSEYAVAADGEDTVESWSFCYNLYNLSEQSGFI